MPETEKILTPEMPAPASPDSGAERPATPEQPSGTPERPADQPSDSTAPAQPLPAAPAPAQPLSPEVQQLADIERILEEDLADIYFALPENKREAFRKKGEATAQEINTLLSSTKLKVQKVISLIRDWLLLIPGINKFFLEQEAKLKADRIIKQSGRF